ncbi:MAG: hypothetical protein AB9856_11325 [Cellulosilyticaceae bacterium]
MKRMKIISGVMVVILVVQGIFAGCAVKTNGVVEKEAPIEISIAFWNIGQIFAGGESDEVLKKIQQDLNIVLKPINITKSNWAEELQRYAAFGELPDIIFHDSVGSSTYEAWIGQQLVRPIPKDLSQYPFLEAYVNQEYNDIFRRNDGNLYMIPRITYPKEEMWALDRCIIVRKDWMEQLGIRDPQNFNEFKQMLKKFVTLDPDKNGKNDTLGFTAVNMNLLEAIYLGIFPELSNSERGWIKEDGEWMPVYNSKKVGQALGCVKELYDEGLIDSNFAYQTSNEAKENFINGKVGAVAVQYHGLAEEWHLKNPNQPFTEVAKVLPMWPAPDGNRYRFTTSLHWSETYISSGVDDKKLDKILELYNYILSDEADRLLNYGIEGVDWEEDKNGEIILHNNMLKDIKTIYPSVEIFRSLAAWHQEELYEERLENYMRFGKEATKYGIEALKWQKENTKCVDYNYKIVFMPSPAKNLLPTNKVIQDYMLKAILGDKPAAVAWEGYMDKIRQETPLNRAINEMTEKANELGIR